MRIWPPWRHPRDDAGRSARDDAARRLAEAEARWVEVNAKAAAKRQRLEKNHIGRDIVAAIRARQAGDR